MALSCTRSNVTRHVVRYAEHLEHLAIQQRVRAEAAEAEVSRKKTQLASVEEELAFAEARVASLKALSGETNEIEPPDLPLEAKAHPHHAEPSSSIAHAVDDGHGLDNSGSEDSAYEPFAAYEPYQGRPSSSSSRAAETTDYEEDEDEDDEDDDDDDDAPATVGFASAPVQRRHCPQPSLVTSTRTRPTVAEHMNEDYSEQRANTHAGGRTDGLRARVAHESDPDVAHAVGRIGQFVHAKGRPRTFLMTSAPTVPRPNS